MFLFDNKRHVWYYFFMFLLKFVVDVLYFLYVLLGCFMCPSGTKRHYADLPKSSFWSFDGILKPLEESFDRKTLLYSRLVICLIYFVALLYVLLYIFFHGFDVVLLIRWVVGFLLNGYVNLLCLLRYILPSKYESQLIFFRLMRRILFSLFYLGVFCLGLLAMLGLI